MVIISRPSKRNFTNQRFVGAAGPTVPNKSIYRSGLMLSRPYKSFFGNRKKNPKNSKTFYFILDRPHQLATPPIYYCDISP
jgi:hypothetical protein